MLPIIDFGGFANGSAANKKAISDAIGVACRDFGFFILGNHGVERHITDKAFATARLFFDQPINVKAEIAIDRSPCHRGWYGAGGEILDAQNQPEGDVKEGLKIGRDLTANHPLVKAATPLHGPNQWPELAGFRQDMQNCYAGFEALSRQLMQAFALSLDLEEHFFDQWLTLPMATLSPLRYPALAMDNARDVGALSAGAHTDFGCLTLLAQLDEPGLEIEMRDGTWLCVPADPDLLVVNIGDMMARWTNNMYRSTRHRVVNRSGETRHSMAYFFDPDADADLSALPGCVKDGQAPNYESSCALDHLLAKIEHSFAYRQEDSR